MYYYNTQFVFPQCEKLSLTPATFLDFYGFRIFCAHIHTTRHRDSLHGTEAQRSNLSTMALFSSLLLLLTPLVALSENTWNSFPLAPKSINFDKASTISFYKLIDAGALGLEDPHAVVGNSVAAGGYLLAGKAMECGDTCPTGYSASNTESFAVKTDANGKLAWTWSSKNGGKNDAANGILELPSKDVLVVGWKQIGSVGYRYMTKLAGATGVEIWTFTGFGDEAGKNGALELAVMDGSTHVVVSGLKNTNFG